MGAPGFNPHPQQHNPAQPYPPQGNHYPQGYQQQHFGPQPQGPMYPPQPPRFEMRLTEHTGMVLMWSQRSYHVVGTIEQCEEYFKRAQTHCLGAGWWSIASLLIFNWIALSGNRRAIKSARLQSAAIAAGYPPRPW